MLTKKQFVDMLDGCPEDAEIYFRIDEGDNEGLAEDLDEVDVCITIRSGRVRVLLNGEINVN